MQRRIENPGPRVPCALAVLSLALTGCARHVHPWDAPDASGPQLTEVPEPPIAPLRARADAGGDGGAADVPPAPPEAAKSPVRVGGPWVRCYGGFHPAGEPIKDVTRLAILCGPENGMKRLSARALEGTLSAGGPGVSETFEAHRGACYRIFAVAEATVADLDVVVRSSRGAPIAADHGEDAWPIVQPDRPFCALEDDRYTFEVSAKKGSGRFAAEVWVLRAPRDPGHAPREGGVGDAPGGEPAPEP